MFGPFDAFELIMVTLTIIYAVSVGWTVVQGLNFLVMKYTNWKSDRKWDEEWDKAILQARTQPMEEVDEDAPTA